MRGFTVPNSFCCSRSVVNCSSAVQQLKLSALQHNSKYNGQLEIPLHLSQFSVFGSQYVPNISALKKLATNAK